ncbi:MAG TPA: cobyrinate a,c-diamide synthase [Ruminiclostridium sp.]|nr:cobyrinate a,c-diamide synthase [Ruminiclostridium sp.]
MKSSNFARVMIAGTGSGCGKTTVTCGILKALVNRGLKTAAFKCGPDYIDPMFHTEITGVQARNIDTFLCGENGAKYLLAKSGQAADISVMEGVMGFYDGLIDERCSSHAISTLTETPAVLVVDGGGMSLSIAALIRGFTDFMPNNIKGVIINNISPGTYPMYKQLIGQYTNIKPLGFLPEIPEAEIKSRHLGLVTAGEIENLHRKLNLLASNAEKYIDLDGLTELAQAAPPLTYNPLDISGNYPCNIAVAMDAAFCFYYRDSLELLELLGAKLTYFSPLKDSELPENAGGVILGGGYPELYAKELSGNISMLRSIKKAAQKGLPVYAECGGFMYLQESIRDGNGISYPMVGAIDGNSTLTGKLSRFGYCSLQAKRENLFCNKGEGINAHEFHFSDSDSNGIDFEAARPGSDVKWDCIFATDTMFAGYPHLHLYGNINFAVRFLQKCSGFDTNSKKID